jgi:flagellar L-ring protein precursor FlgH
MAQPQSPPVANGAIFQDSGYVPLTSGTRAAAIGDIVTIQLVERISASKSNSASSGRNGSVGVTPPATGPLDIFAPSDLNMGGDQSFKGKGEAAQSSNLNGEISVTISAVYPNGTMRVAGEKLLTLNRGDERVQFSALPISLLTIAFFQAASPMPASAIPARVRLPGRASRAGCSVSFRG